MIDHRVFSMSPCEDEMKWNQWGACPPAGFSTALTSPLLPLVD